MIRKSKFRYSVALLSMVMLLGLLAACGSNNNGQSSSSATPTRGSTTAASPTNEPPFEITMIATQHAAEVPSDLIPNMIAEKTNTILKIQWTPDGSYTEKLNSSFATGTLPMIVFSKDMAFAKEAIRDEQFWEIGPYLNDYEYLKNLNPEVLNNTSVDGKIYSLYQERPLSRQGVIYRKDWADHLGLGTPETIEDLYEMALAFTHNDPDNNGLDDTIGLADRSDLIYGAFKTVSSYFGTPNYWGVTAEGEIYPEFADEAYLDTLDFFHKLHSEGLMNHDFPITSKTDQVDMIVTGKAGIYIGALGDVLSLHNQIIELNPAAELTVANGFGEGVWAIPGYGSVVLFPKSAIKTEDDLKKVLAFMDELMNPETANLLHWGIEGEHYELVEGKVNKNIDAATDNAIVKPNNAWVIGGHATIDGLLYGYYELPARQLAEELIYDNERMLIHNPAAPLDSRTFTERGESLQQIINDATYQYVMGELNRDGFLQQVERWKNEGGQQIINEYTEAYRAAQ